MKQCSASPNCHNLNINMYSFKEVLGLFQLNYAITAEDLKRAKTMVLRMHPDKSRLPPDYFLFYKKAFEIVVEYYNNHTKASKEVPTTEQIYNPLNPVDKRTEETVKKSIHEMGKDRFNQTFNTIFETNMKKPVQDHNDWFKKHDPLYQFDDISSAGGIASAVETIKKNASSLIKYNGVETMRSAGPTYGNLYDDDADANAEGSPIYIASDPFSKLKFDDLRKVHKDQTVFAVSERDYENVPKFASIDQLQRERGSLNIKHVERAESEKILFEREEALKQRMAAKQHAETLRTMEYAEKNKSVMATFFTLKN
jgi:hypothetical protein